MAFVVENGSGLPDATSLVDLDFANDYFDGLGNEDWVALTNDQKQVRLNRGTQYTCSYYTFKGVRLSPQQTLCFPRKEVMRPDGTPETGVPTCVKKVVCEMAVRATTTAILWPDPLFDQGGRAVKRILKQIGTLKKDIEYASTGEYINEARYPSVDALMCSWLIVEEDEKYANGVIISPGIVTGTSNRAMAIQEENKDRYSGPYNENKKDESFGGGITSTNL